MRDSTGRVKKTFSDRHTGPGGPQRCLLAAGLIAALITWAGTTFADEAATSSQLEEVVVTARKRTESIQEVPMSVTAFDATSLNRNVVTSFADLPMIPNVQLTTISTAGYGIVSYIRGIGNKAQEPELDPGVAISIDGVYLAAATGANIDLFDVQQIEVLNGPQGTLQGRNSPGGAINVTTRRPTGQYDVDAEVGYATFEEFTEKLSAEAPLITDIVAARVSVVRTRSDGSVRDLYTGTHTAGEDLSAARLSLLFTPTDAFGLFVSGDWTLIRSEPPGVRGANDDTAYPNQPVPLFCSSFDLCTPSAPHTTTADYTKPDDVHLGGVSATADWQLGGTTLTSVTGYRVIHEDENFDLDGTQIPALALTDRLFNLDTLSEEARLSSRKGGGLDIDGKFDWLLGGIIYRSRFDVVQPVSVFGSVATEFESQKLRSNAGFASTTYHINEDWSLSGGVRRSMDHKDFNGVPSGYPQSSRVFLSGDWSNTSFEAGSEYHLGTDKLLYARFSQGYRSGGMTLAASPADTTEFRPETVNSYEVGAKTEWLDRRLLVNASAFIGDYKDIQLSVTQPSLTGQGFATVIKNAAAAKIPGAELEVVARPVEPLTGRLSAGYLDAHYTSFFADVFGTGVPVNNAGLRLPYAPKWTLSGGGDYVVPANRWGSITFSGMVSYVSSQTTLATDLPVGNQNGYSLVNVQAMFKTQDERFTVTVYAKNLLNRNYITAGEDVSNVALFQVDGPPRTVGVRFTANLCHRSGDGKCSVH